jgi:hypothetical protein
MLPIATSSLSRGTLRLVRCPRCRQASSSPARPARRQTAVREEDLGVRAAAGPYNRTISPRDRRRLHRSAGYDFDPVPPHLRHLTILSPLLRVPFPSQFLHACFFCPVFFRTVSSKVDCLLSYQAPTNRSSPRFRHFTSALTACRRHCNAASA